MRLVGHVIKTGIQLGAVQSRQWLSPAARQRRVLLRLLSASAHTAFGRHYGFASLLWQRDAVKAFQTCVPTHDYDKIYREWWHRSRQDEPNVCWPGIVPWYAMSSGTSNASSKYIPVTRDLIRSMSRLSRRVFFDMANFHLPADLFTKQMLMVGSTTNLQREGGHWIGDLSGIIALNRPFWLKKYYRPERDITDLMDWGERIERIVERAPRWDIGFIVGNVAWVQMVIERVVARYDLRHIHELWPNFSLLMHSGIFFEPYQPTFERLLGRPVQYVDSYLASEGFIGYQRRPDTRLHQLAVNAGIFFEFVPFNDSNFDDDGNLRPNAETLWLPEIEPGQPYALLLSTEAGCWRYLLGDTIEFSDTQQLLFRITGRTKHFLSVTGEHVSVDNLNAAVRAADQQMKLGVKEFTVAAEPCGSHWAHHWYISADHPEAHNPHTCARLLDEHLQAINDDYHIERRYALHEVRVTLLPHSVFYQWLEQHGKLNGQAKVPRVLKGKAQQSWEAYWPQILSRKQ